MRKDKVPTISAVELQNIRIERGSFELNIPELCIPRGKIGCIVGPNGSGKTTLIHIILGLLPHRGKCLVNGSEYDGTQTKIKSKIGYIPDDPELLFGELTGAEQWSVTASVLAEVRLSAHKETMTTYAAELARRLSFTPPRRPIREYSHGMRKKTQIVNAMLGSPDILLIDELRNGLDPVAILQAEHLVKQFCTIGTTIIAATHDLWWAERFADSIYVLDKGRVIAAGSLAEILRGKEQHLEQAFSRLLRVKL